MGAARQLHANLVAQSSDPLAPARTDLSLAVSMSEDARTEKKSKNRKKKAEEKCDAKCKWTTEEIRKPLKWFDGKYKQLEKECEAHGVSQSGNMKDMRIAMRKHYDDKTHPVFARKAARLAGWGSLFNHA